MPVTTPIVIVGVRMSSWSDNDAAGAVEDPAALVRARRKRTWLIPTVVVLGALVAGAAVLVVRYQAAERAAAVEALTEDAHRFVTLVRSGMPAEWSIERVLEFPTLRPDAVALTDLRHKRGQARVDLENKARALLGGKSPELGPWMTWITKPQWMSRDQLAGLAGTLHELDAHLVRLRTDAGLEPRPLPLAGAPLPPLPERLPLPALPDGVEYLGSQAWPLPVAVVVFQWGPDKRQPCDLAMRDPRCNALQVSWVNWEGRVIGTAAIASPPRSSRRWDWGVGPDATFFTIIIAEDGAATLTAYEPGAEPRAADVKLGDYARLVPAREGLVVQTYEGVLLVRGDGTPRLEPIEAAYYDIPFDHVGLKRREGQGSPLSLPGGGSVQIRREDGVLLARYQDPEGGPEQITRLADFTHDDEAFLRQLARGPDDRLALIFEGSMSQLSVLLSADGGRTWTGAPPGGE